MILYLLPVLWTLFFPTMVMVSYEDFFLRLVKSLEDLYMYCNRTTFEGIWFVSVSIKMLIIYKIIKFQKQIISSFYSSKPTTLLIFFLHIFLPLFIFFIFFYSLSYSCTRSTFFFPFFFVYQNLKIIPHFCRNVTIQSPLFTISCVSNPCKLIK